MQVWPALLSFPYAIDLAARIGEKPRSTIAGDLPPSSSVTGTRFALAARMTARPTLVLPVNTRWSNGSAAKASPTSEPPVTTATCSSAKSPAPWSTISSDVFGVCSEGFSIARLPAAIAVASGVRQRLAG